MRGISAEEITEREAEAHLAALAGRGREQSPATGTFGVLELPSLRFRVLRARDGAEVTILRKPLR